MIIMKGQITIYNVLLFYTVFLLIIGYIGTLAGVTLVQMGGDTSNIPIPQNPLDLVGMFNFFVALLSTNTTYQFLAIIFVTPFLVLLAYAIMQLIRGTG